MIEYTLEKRYQIFLNMFGKELERMFKNQAEFIKCKEGCSYCCEKGEYPFSELEYKYLLEGYKKLDNKTKQQILNNVNRINEEKKNHKDGKFMYDCPFLINHRCSVYENRGIICRTFGLLCEHEDEHLTMPFCQALGLNYSQIYDEEKGQLITEKDGKKLCATEPHAYRISREHIQKISIAKNLNIEWGESKTLIDYINETDFSGI